MLLEILVSDTLIIGIRPKYNNEIRYTFNISNLSEHILKNASRYKCPIIHKPFNDIEDIINLITNGNNQ